MNTFLRNSTNKILNLSLLKSKRFFSQKIYRHITPKNSQEYHDKKEFENYKDNVKFSFKIQLHFNARKPTSNIFATTPLYPDDNKPIDLMDEQNIYESEHLFKYQKFLKNRENDLKTLVKKKMKTTRHNHIKTGFNNKAELLKQLQVNSNEDFNKELQA